MFVVCENYYNYRVFSQKILNQNIKSLKIVFLGAFFLLNFNCVKKNSEEIQSSSQNGISSIVKNNTVTAIPDVDKTAEAEKLEKEKLRNLKTLADLIRFLASIEKETLKVAQPSIGTTQWDVISFAFDKFVGIKRANPGFFCHQYEIKSPSHGFFEVYAICEKPFKKLMTLKYSADSEAVFYSRNWAPVIGELPSLTASDRSCHFSSKETSIASFTCKNTIYALPPDNLEELRLEKFEFDRTGVEQVVLEGGIFKDLVKRRDLKMRVPMSGAIDIIEKELKVRDDFEHLLKKPKR